MNELSAIRRVLAAHRSTAVHVTAAEVESAWAEYEAVRGVVREMERWVDRYQDHQTSFAAFSAQRVEEWLRAVREKAA